MIRLTERDKRFLKLVGEAGACSAKIPKQIYPARYARNRLEKLEEEKIINRKYNLITLSTKCIEYLKEEGEGEFKNVNTYTREQQIRLSETLDLKYILSGMEIISSRKYKKINKLNRGMLFLATARIAQSKDYLIYKIKSKVSAEIEKQIIKELCFSTVNYGAIILTKNKHFVQKVMRKNIPLKELLVLPNQEYFIQLLNASYKKGFDKEIISKAYPQIKEEKAFEKIFKEKQPQYIFNQEVYINMVLNNISTFTYLMNINTLYIISNAIIKYKYKIVCLDIQKGYIENELRKRKIDNLDIEIKTLSKGEYKC